MKNILYLCLLALSLLFSSCSYSPEIVTFNTQEYPTISVQSNDVIVQNQAMSCLRGKYYTSRLDTNAKALLILTVTDINRDFEDAWVDEAPNVTKHVKHDKHDKRYYAYNYKEDTDQHLERIYHTQCTISGQLIDQRTKDVIWSDTNTYSNAKHVRLDGKSYNSSSDRPSTDGEVLSSSTNYFMQFFPTFGRYPGDDVE